jgi:hypothetical protein
MKSLLEAVEVAVAPKAVEALLVDIELEQCHFLQDLIQ